MSLSDELYSLYYMLLYIVVSLQIAECFVHEWFFLAGCGSGGGEGVKENVEVSIFQRIDKWKNLWTER